VKHVEKQGLFKAIALFSKLELWYRHISGTTPAVANCLGCIGLKVEA
jgi:hypothetical protein